MKHITILSLLLISCAKPDSNSITQLDAEAIEPSTPIEATPQVVPSWLIGYYTTSASANYYLEIDQTGVIHGRSNHLTSINSGGFTTVINDDSEFRAKINSISLKSTSVDHKAYSLNVTLIYCSTSAIQGRFLSYGCMKPQDDELELLVYNDGGVTSFGFAYRHDDALNSTSTPNNLSLIMFYK